MELNGGTVTYGGQSYPLAGIDGFVVHHDGPLDGTSGYPLAHLAGPGTVTHPVVAVGADSYHFSATITGAFDYGPVSHTATADQAAVVLARLDLVTGAPTFSVAYEHVGAETIETRAVGSTGDTQGATSAAIAAVMGEGTIDFGNGTSVTRAASCPGLEVTACRW
jgi:hypothetical protein